MKELMLLIRISKPEYNKTLYHNYVMYMNPQTFFKNNGNNGQRDPNEGLIYDSPGSCLFFSADGEKYEKLGDIKKIHKDTNAYIYCMYALKYNDELYDKKNNKYVYTIKWESIEPLWNDDENEIMIIKNTKDFIEAFMNYLKMNNLNGKYGDIKYDLEHKSNNYHYFNDVSNDSFATVFHKTQNMYEDQNEFRFAIIPDEDYDNYNLCLRTENFRIVYDLKKLVYGEDVIIEIYGLKFENNHLIGFKNCRIL